MNFRSKKGENFSRVIVNHSNRIFKEGLMNSSFFDKSVPAVNVIEENDHFKIEVAAPGRNIENFKITVKSGVLKISCDAMKGHEKNYERKEFGYSSFQRFVTLPESAKGQDLYAIYRKGILEIKLAKKPDAHKSDT